MAESVTDTSLRRATSFATFAALGALSTTQDVARTVLRSIDGAEQELVAEETLCLVATASARAARVGLRKAPSAMAEAATSSLLELPFSYRDYLIGGAMIASGDAAMADQSDDIYARLTRKQQFYTAQLPDDQFPGQHALTDVMELWMGRVSPPKLPEPPQERLQKLGLVPVVLTHLKLVLAAARRHAKQD